MCVKEEQKFRVLQSAVHIFPWDGEVTGGWIKLLNNDIHNLKYSPIIIMEIKEEDIGEACSKHRWEIY